MSAKLITFHKHILTDGSLEAVMSIVSNPALLIKKVRKELADESEKYLKKRLSHTPSGGKAKPYKRSGDLSESFDPSAMKITSVDGKNVGIDFVFRSKYARLQDKGMKPMKARKADWLTIPVHPNAFDSAGRPKPARSIVGMHIKPSKRPKKTLFLMLDDTVYYVLKKEVIIPRTYFVTKDLLQHFRTAYVNKYFKKSFEAYKKSSKVKRGEVKNINQLIKNLKI